jgi:hypothetical protein
MKSIYAFAAVLYLCLSQGSIVRAETIDFSRDILPILSANCFACHGPDEHERQADLRLDIEASAKQDLGNGSPILAGDSAKSLIVQRILSESPDEVMPPPSANKKIKPEQLELIKKWIDQGATWKRHWSLNPITPPAGTLDDQVRAKLAEQGLALQPVADPHTLVRRLSIDLLGLPPTPEQADQFATDPSSQAYEKLVDSLLDSPKYGEHWARMWLDLARYADTKGYEKDLGRTMWPYRDWVIGAFNEDMPLDQFTLEQLAGDLLSNPTESQRIATAFHRNTMSNDEGGTDDEEFRVAAVKDRVDTTIQVWMGLTMGCAKCHSHKYDPISMEDYYRFFAIFNQTEDADRYDDSPRIDLISPEQKAASDEALRKIAASDNALSKAKEEAAFHNDPATGTWHRLNLTSATAREGTKLDGASADAIQASGDSPEKDIYVIQATLPAGRYTALRLEALTSKLSDGQIGLGRNPSDPNFVVSELILEKIDVEGKAQAVKLVQPQADFSQQGWPVSAAIDGDTKTGWAVSPRSRENHLAIFNLESPLESTDTISIRITLDQQYGNRLVLGKFRLSFSSSDPNILKPEITSPEVKKAAEALAVARKEYNALQDNIVRLPILSELAKDRQRQTRIHQRGNFLDPGNAVEPALLTSFHKLQDEMPLNRIVVAKWLTSPENTLTTRVWVNRIWARLFGIGIVETEEDFGALGAQPSNPALLDWLANEYRRGNLSNKKLLKTIVMSDTYKQVSNANADIKKVDPRNTLSSRGSRYRLAAEVVRDQALAISGLLSSKMGGPAVMPPQPAGLWRSTYNGKNWIDAEGEDRFRRGIYTYLKRTTPYPSFTSFDAGSGEVCLVRRVRTNTPLQALITLNDPVYLEAAGALARKVVTEQSDDQARIERALRLALIRPVKQNEFQPLLSLQQQASQWYQEHPDQAKALIKSARVELPEGMSENTLAAWVVTASAILNLDEFLSRN